MNYRERMREYLKEPNQYSSQYGKWGSLNREQRQMITRLLNEMDNADEFIKHQFFEIERLNKELEIYKLRHKLALKKLNSAMKHYDLEDKNNTIRFCKEILEGKGIEEKCHKKLRGDK